MVNELRIGNYIFKEGAIILVSASTLMTMQNEDAPYYHPVIITEELLLKCGLETETYHSGQGEIKVYELDRLVVAFLADEWWFMNEYDSWVSAKRSLSGLHDLQNLYFALTGEELIINL